MAISRSHITRASDAGEQSSPRAGRRPPSAPEASDNPDKVFTIGDLAREFDVTLRTLRFYEDKGLLEPRREGMNRLYSRRDRARLKLILMGKKVGFSLVDIKNMLDLYDLKDGPVVQLKVAQGKFAEQLRALEAQKHDIEHAIAELSRTLDIVRDMIREKEGGASPSDARLT